MCLFFLVIVYGFYHGKSPFGTYFYSNYLKQIFSNNGSRWNHPAKLSESVFLRAQSPHEKNQFSTLCILEKSRDHSSSTWRTCCLTTKVWVPLNQDVSSLFAVLFTWNQNHVTPSFCFHSLKPRGHVVYTSLRLMVWSFEFQICCHPQIAL